MNTVVGNYPTHEEAIEAVQKLRRAGYPIEQISLIGQAVIIDDLMRPGGNRAAKNIPVIIGAILGPVIGILIGAKVLDVPGLHILYGEGVILGALAGFSLGLVIGGIPSLIATLVSRNRSLRYKEHTEEKGFQVVAHGSDALALRAREILEKD